MRSLIFVLCLRDGAARGQPAPVHCNSLSACRVDSRTRTFMSHGTHVGAPPGPNGGIGRRAALKMQYRKVCGFESHFGHQPAPFAVAATFLGRGAPDAV